MRIGVLGTGAVGQAIATRLIGLGHEVRIGSREAGNEMAAAWRAPIWLKMARPGASKLNIVIERAS